MSDVFQEVEEEYRRQQLSKFWEKYRVPAVGAAAALVLGVAGYQGWTYWHGKQVEKSSRELEAVGELIRKDEKAEKDAADRLAKLGKEGSGGYPVLAKFQEAGMRAELRDFKAAVAIYDDIVRTNKEPLFRDFAAIRAGVLLSESEPLDKLKARLEPVANGKGPWAMSGKELLAYVTWQAGKTDEALKIYDEIVKSEDAPNGTKRRAVEMTAVLKSGLKPSDVKAPARVSLPAPDIGPLLLPPTTPEQPGSSLLGPSPAFPAPAAPEPVVPTPDVPTSPTP